MKKKIKKHRSNYWQLLPYFWPQLETFWKGFACVLGYVSFTALLPYLAGRAASVVGQGDVEQILYWLGLATIVFLVRSCFQYGETVFMLAVSLNITVNLRNNLYNHLHKLDLDYFLKSQTGDLSYRLTEEIDRIGEIINKLCHQFLSCSLQLIFLPIYMFYLNWQLTLASLIIAPLMAWLIGLFGNKILSLSAHSQNQTSRLASLITEVFSGIRLVQSFAAQDYETERFSYEARKNRNAQYKTQRIKAFQYPVVGFLEAVSIMSLFLIGGWQISQGNLTSQALISYLAAVALLIDPINLITNQYNEFKQTEASVNRVFELMAITPKVQEHPQANNLDIVAGKVEYNNVTFGYESSQTVLENFYLTVSPGQIIALVGHSGAGKTTVINLLMRFYDPQLGKILIDEVDISKVTIKSLRSQIGIVPQETILFSGTIAENIAYGQKELDFATIEKAAKIANAHSFIRELPQGYNTWLGEQGVNLSGGQRQRLAIARAVFPNPKILILDEATSALDSESETLVQEALERVMKNRTVFIIAHRLSTIRRANNIVVLEQGKVVETGTHEELLAQNSKYAQFYAQQFV